jgi:hypothetical protein
MADTLTDDLCERATKALRKLAFKADPEWTLFEWAAQAKDHVNKRKGKVVVTATARAPREVARQILLTIVSREQLGQTMPRRKRR